MVVRYEKPLKLALGKKILPSAGLRSLGGYGFLPGHEEISIPDNQPIQKSYMEMKMEMEIPLHAGFHPISDLVSEEAKAGCERKEISCHLLIFFFFEIWVVFKLTHG